VRESEQETARDSERQHESESGRCGWGQRRERMGEGCARSGNEERGKGRAERGGGEMRGREKRI